MKKLTCSYLYADGHAILLYEKDDKDAGTITFCEVHEKWTDARLYFKGRLIFGRYDSEMMKLAKRAHSIDAKEPALNYGSENTKRMGIAYGSLEYRMSAGHMGNGLHWAHMPGLISSCYTYQPDCEEVCPSPHEAKWCGYPIGKFHPTPKPQPVAVAA